MKRVQKQRIVQEPPRIVYRSHIRSSEAIPENRSRVWESKKRDSLCNSYCFYHPHQRSRTASQTFNSTSTELSIAVRMGKVKKAKKEKGDNKAEVRPRSLASVSPRTE